MMLKNIANLVFVVGPNAFDAFDQFIDDPTPKTNKADSVVFDGGMILSFSGQTRPIFRENSFFSFREASISLF